MLRPLMLATLLAWCAMLSPRSATADSVIVSYERVFTLLTEVDNRFWFRLFENGRAQAYLPPVMTHAGSYEWQLSEAELAALIDELNQSTRSSGDLGSLVEAMELLLADDHWSIEDADQVSIAFSHPSLGNHQVEVMAPDAMAHRFPQHPEVLAAAHIDALLMNQALAIARSNASRDASRNGGMQ